MNKKSIITTFALLAMVFASTAVFAGPGMGRGQGAGPGYGCGQGYGPGMGQASNLTPEQQEKLTQLQDEHFKTMDGLRAEMLTRSTKLDALLVDPAAQRADVDSAIKAVNETRSKMFEERVNFHKKVSDETGIRQPLGRHGRGGNGPGNGYRPCGYNQDNRPCVRSGYGQGAGCGPGAGCTQGYGPGHGRGGMGSRW